MWSSMELARLNGPPTHLQRGQRWQQQQQQQQGRTYLCGFFVARPHIHDYFLTARGEKKPSAHPARGARHTTPKKQCFPSWSRCSCPCWLGVMCSCTTPAVPTIVAASPTPIAPTFVSLPFFPSNTNSSVHRETNCFAPPTQPRAGMHAPMLGRLPATALPRRQIVMLAI